ncbi:MAG TPA: hypothetical protein VGM39_16500 [Kofleriaceae bacterium]
MYRALALLSHVALAGVAVLGVSACGGKKDPPIASLTKADGPVDRQAGLTGPWGGAKIGTGYFLTDAARTGNGGAELTLTGGHAKIAMQPHTKLRFGGTGTNSKIALEDGIIDLSGDGLYGTEFGDVKLKNGTVRITAGTKEKPKATIVLTVGDAEVVNEKGQTAELVVDSVVDVDSITFGGVTDVPDAGVADAGVDAAPDAGVVVSPTEATYIIDGKKAEQLLPGETKWVAIDGSGTLTKGAKLRVGAGTTARIVAAGTTLAMKGGSRMMLDPNLLMTLEAGDATLIAAANAEGKLGLPGGDPNGAVVLGANPNGGEANIDVNARETKVSLRKGTGHLKGSAGGEMDLTAGESATLAKTGSIRQTVVIPKYYDLRIAAGESATIHDYSGKTAVQFAFGEKCSGGNGFVELDSDNRFQTAAISPGKDQANMLVQAGSWAYRIRCSSNENTVASGRISVLRDAGTRKLLPPLNIPIDPDGRSYRLDYQSSIPDVTINTKGTGSNFKIHMATGGKEQVFEGKGGKVKIPGKSLDEGVYTYYQERDGVKDTKISTLTIGFDNTAPQASIERPVQGKAWDAQVDIRGSVLVGWSASVDAVPLPINPKDRRFTGKVDKPTGAQALAIKLSHPQRGFHYYIRRDATKK